MNFRDLEAIKMKIPDEKIVGLIFCSAWDRLCTKNCFEITVLEKKTIFMYFMLSVLTLYACSLRQNSINWLKHLNAPNFILLNEDIAFNSALI